MTPSPPLHFKPHARLLTMLGDQLIKNERIALVEIIKNAYDADASWVKVTFEDFGSNYEVQPKSKIIIEDDGTGMTKRVLEEDWLSPATPIKKLAKAAKDSTPKGRKLQGEKGIGRFAILKLGRTVLIITRPEKAQQEFTLNLDLSHYDDDFLCKDGVSKSFLLEDIDLSLSVAGKATYIKAEEVSLGARVERRNPHGTRIEVSNLRGSWTNSRVDAVYEDLIRLQSIFDKITKASSDNKKDQEEPSDFEVLIYKDSKFENYSTAYLEELRALIENNAVLRITEGRYDEPRKTFKFQLDGKPLVLPLGDPDITGITLFREAFGDKGEVLQNRGTKCGSFSFGFYIFDFSKDAKGKHHLDEKDKKLLKQHRIYLYRDGIRVYPYGDADDDWLQTDMYRGTKAAGMFLSNDQVFGFVNVTQKDNPEFKDKTNREGLIEIGDATSDFRHLLQIFLAWVRKKPYEQYRIKTRENKDAEIVKKEQVRAGLDALELELGDNKPAQAALKEIAALYQTERSYLIQRAETTETLAGVGLSVETASHDIMAVMRRGLVALDTLISETQKPGALAKDFINRELISLRGMLSFVEAQLKDIQMLFKSSKQRRKDIRVREVLQKVQKLFAPSLTKENVAFNLEERGSPLVAKTTDAVLLQLFLNLFDNSLYWLRSKDGGKRQIEVLLDGDEGLLIFADNGPGVKADDAPYIFEPFYSGRGEDGRGLGLYIARQLLKRHDYSIELAGHKAPQATSWGEFRGVICQNGGVMRDPTLFHGIAVAIDDEINEPNTNVVKILEAIEAAGCHVIKLSGIPTETGISNLREVAFVILDWKLYGADLKAIEGQPVPPTIIEANEASIIKFLRDFKKVRFAPVFIFTDEPEDKILGSLRKYEDVYNEGDPTHIRVMDKKKVLDTGVFNVLTEWMEANPSVYVLKEWEKAYAKAKNELFLDFYVNGTLWPLILWKNFEDDSVPPAVQIGELIGHNLASRMTPFSCDLVPFADLLEGIKKDPGAYKNVVQKVLEGERFLAEMRLDKDSFEPGDIFLADDSYRINIRPDCDCVPKGNDRLDRLDLYLLKGTERPMTELNYDSKYGLIPEQENEAVVFPVYDGKALCFKFRKLYTQKWQELKERRVGRLLPPFLTRLQQRYSSYLQRPGLGRLPSAAFPSPAPTPAPEAPKS